MIVAGMPEPSHLQESALLASAYRIGELCLSPMEEGSAKTSEA
jgi:hypothetical protein